MKEISVINGVQCYEVDGIAFLDLEAVARGLGFTQEKNGIQYVKWERVNGYLKELGFSPEVGKGDFIPENIFYRLAMKAKNETAERFQALVADEIIPQIRRTGSYSVKRSENSENVYLKAAQILSRCTAANRPYVLAMLEAGGIKVDVEEERPKAKELPAAPKKERRGETIYGMSHERDVLFALWNCELPLKELAGVTGIPLETLRSYYFAKTIPTERHIGLLKEALKYLINNKVGA